MKIKLPSFVQTRLDNFLGNNVEQETIPAYGGSINDKCDGTFRVGSQNINSGLNINTIYSGAEEIDVMDTLGIDVMALGETNRNLSHDQRITLNAMMRLKFGHGITASASCKNKEIGYLPGGTAMLARGRVSGRIEKRVSDELGRFNYMTFRGKDDTGVIMINMYRVCQKKGSKTGPDTAYMQQIEGLREKGIKNPDPRSQIFTDVTEIIKEWAELGYHPMVMGDMNADYNDEDFKKFIQENGLNDLIKENNKGPPPKTYSRGKKRIDYILGDDYVANAVVKSGALASQEGVLSDHTMQWVDLDVKLLFKNKSYIPMKPCEREFTLVNAKKKRTFQEELLKSHKENKTKEKVEKLSEDFEKMKHKDIEDREMIPLVERYQTLDYEIVRIIKAAANAVGRKNFGYQRSPELIRAGKQVTFWRAVHSCKRRKAPYTIRVITLAGELGIGSETYHHLTAKESRTRVSIAWKHKRGIEKQDGEHRAKWLEDLAQEAALLKPGSEWEKVLAQMINVSRQRALNSKLSSLTKDAHSGLDYVEVPQEK